MKKILSISAAILLLAGCAATFSQVVYRSQATSMGVYKLVNSELTDLRANALVSDQGWAEYSALANKFLDAHKEVSLAMVKYKQGKAPQSTIELTQKAMLLALEKVKEYYLSKIPKDKQKALF